ncbi:MAG: glucose-6-phosphate dehydrogenase [Candidatus Binatia bacterium]
MQSNPCDEDGIRAAGPCVLVLFGASGDLTKRKLIPALYNLVREKLLPENFAVVGFARRDTTTEDFREQTRRNIAEYAPDGIDEATWSWLESRFYFVPGSFDDAQAYVRLREQLVEAQATHKTGGNVLFYLAASPEYFGVIVEQLSTAEMVKNENGSWRRVVVEKPFGRDLASARDLNRLLLRVLDERQIYRIDHYLGKETVQNILVLRFANGIFEPVWNRRYVDHVQITVAEALGVEGRGGYYEEAGALRDMVPNHVFQLISLIALEPPISFDADAVRDEQSKVLRAVQPMAPEDVLTRAVRGQYGAGRVGDRHMVDYRQEDRVDSLSKTETFVAMKIEIDNWRWKDVPFYLRVGKAMPERMTEIVVQFRRPPFALFRHTAVCDLQANQLVIRVQPDEGISLSFGAKIPGATMRIGTVDMDFQYAEHFGNGIATGYERLLHDAFLGDQTLFQRADMVEAAWEIVTPVLDVWGALAARDFPNYAAGSWGPEDAVDLIESDGRKWRQ